MVAYVEKQPCSETFLERMIALNPRFSVSAYFMKFGELKTNLDRVKFVYKDLKKYNLFPKWTKQGKDDSLAKDRREKGNKIFKDGDFVAALDKYNDALAVAKSEKEVSMMYANRSACLFKIGRYQECITDIERAFTNNYSGSFKSQLLERRYNAQRLLTVMKPPPPFHDTIPKIPADRQHPQIQSAKDCLEVKTDPQFGQYVVAAKDIEIGEIISVENSFAMFFVDAIHKHCHFCSEFCYNPIPCKGCRLLLFCSESCRDEAYNSHHKFECGIFESLMYCGVNCVEVLALRVAILARDHYNEIDSLILDQKDIYRSDRYKEIHNLSTGIDKRPVEQLFHFAVTAAYMHYFLLKKTTFFNGITKKEVFVDLVFRQLLVVTSHKLPIQEELKLTVQLDMKLPFDCRRVITAWGLYSFCSFFKHSCCPNVENIQYGSTMVLKSLNTIKEGEECFISYGVTYQDDFLSRQKYLRRYGILNCKCDACKNDMLYYRYLPRYETPMYLDLGITQDKLLDLWTNVFGREYNAINAALPDLEKHLRKLEKKESLGNVVELKGLISACYRIFGNNRCLF